MKKPVFYAGLCAVLCALLSLGSFAQKRGRDKNVPVPVADTISKSKKVIIQPYKDIVNAQTKTYRGLITVHFSNDKYYFELNDSIFDREILIVNRISKSDSWLKNKITMRGYNGERINDRVIKFSKGPGRKIFINDIFHFDFSQDSSADGMSRSLRNSVVEPIMAAFDPVSYREDSLALLIDVTGYLTSENDILYFNQGVKQVLSIGNLQADQSYIKQIRSYPMHTEIKTVRTYAGSPGMAAGGHSFVTLELNNSIVLLPKNRMSSRLFDKRVGYFTSIMLDYDVNPQGVKRNSVIYKWRLEPRVEDIEKYKRGELVEPVKPIVFYIDPSTPKKWIPYLIQGVTDWQKAFEKAGFKNAIRAYEAPGNDSTWSLEDAFHNSIVYKPSDVENASGPVIVDYASGEILESHIEWHHNVMQLLHDWYFIQAGAIDPRAMAYTYPDSLMGRLIRYVCAHEVGHTLGLRHNFAASACYPTDSLRNNAWVTKNGITPSIMDYARFNYIAQPADSLELENIIPRTGVYDEWAIEWGYRLFYDVEKKDEKEYLNKWVIKKLEQNPFLRFGAENITSDPRNQAEDLGDDAIKASEYGTRNLKRVMKRLVVSTKIPNDDYSYLRAMYPKIVSQYRNYLFHVADCLGGTYNDWKTTEQEGCVWRFVPKEVQKNSLAFIDKEFFNGGEWIVDSTICSLTSNGTVYDLVYLQKDVLDKMITDDILGSMFWANATNKNNYSAQEYLHDLSNLVFKELEANKNISLSRRSLQKLYVERLSELMSPYTGNNYTTYTFSVANARTDVSAILRGHLKEVYSLLKSAKLRYPSGLVKMHLEEMADKLDALLWDKNKKAATK